MNTARDTITHPCTHSLLLLTLFHFFSFLPLPLFFRCPWKGREIKESQIIHRWYNFHFSSPTTAARPSASAHTTPPPPGGGAGCGRPPQRRSPRKPTPPPAAACARHPMGETQPDEGGRRGSGRGAGARLLQTSSPSGMGNSPVRLRAQALGKGAPRRRKRMQEPRSDAARVALQIWAPFDSHFHFLPLPASGTPPLDPEARARPQELAAGCPARGTKNFGRDVPAAATAVKSPNFP